jgi:hypothetical protein
MRCFYSYRLKRNKEEQFYNRNRKPDETERKEEAKKERIQD